MMPNNAFARFGLGPQMPHIQRPMPIMRGPMMPMRPGMPQAGMGMQRPQVPQNYLRQRLAMMR